LGGAVDQGGHGENGSTGAEQTQEGRVDVNDLGRRARRLLEATATPGNSQKLF
jgi:hypothetical protein